MAGVEGAVSAEHRICAAVSGHLAADEAERIGQIVELTIGEARRAA